MAQYTPFERFLAAAKFEKVDYVPVVGAITHVYMNHLMGYQSEGIEALLNRERNIDILRSGVRIFPEVPLIFIVNPFSNIFMDMLLQLDNRDAFYWGQSELRMGKIKTAEDLAKIDIPEPFTSDVSRFLLGEWKWYVDHIPPDLKKDYGYCDGLIRFDSPFDTLTQNVGASEWFIKMRTEPSFVHRAMGLFTEAAIVGAKALARAIGEPKWVILAEDFPGMISAEHYRQFVLPYHQRILATFPQALKLLHNDSNTTHLLDVLPECGMDIFHLGYEVNLRLAKEKMGKKVALMGNIAPMGVLLRGSDEMVRQVCREHILIGKEGGGFIFSSGGEVNRGTDPARIRLMVEYAKKFGRYDGLSA